MECTKDELSGGQDCSIFTYLLQCPSFVERELSTTFKGKEEVADCATSTTTKHEKVCRA
jgi:hypothetical protein